MNEICGDNRFEIIAKAKAHLLDATNIDTSEDEMKVLDDFLFRCWQMGWLDRYDTADTPQTERIKTPDYCDICKQDMCKDCVADATNPYCVPSHYEINYEPKDEPTTQTETQNSNLTFEKDDTPQTEEFKNFDREDLILLIECQKERIGELLADKDTPQTGCSKCETYWNCQGQCDEMPQIEDEPQTER